MLTDNDERFGVHYFDFATGIVIVTHFQGCNGTGDLLTRQVRNFIYSDTSAGQ